MRKLLYLAGAVLLPASLSAAQKASVSGSEFKVIEITPEKSTGLDCIFVVYDTQGCFLTYNTTNGYTVTVSRYSNLGGGHAQEVTDAERELTSVKIPLSSEDMGYLIEDGNSHFYCWVVNYANHVMSLESVMPSNEPECSYSVLNIEGDAPAITYYAIAGQPNTLSREIDISYTTQEFNKDIYAYEDVEVTKVFESLRSVVSLSPPAYCDTYFTVSGDRFLREWGMELSAETGRVAPVAVACTTEAIQEENSSDSASNVINGGDSSGLGGSAPADISFYSYNTAGVIHYEWQMSRYQDFENPDYRFYQKDLDYTFTEEGTWYLRFIGSNADGSCETYGETYTVTIGASALECPNAFSPNGDGINDEWKVSYRSLVDFHCEIFNRNGQRIFGFDDPSLGWDGTWHGKPVKSGVYFYVITATGADGKKYKKSGDINILNTINYGTSSPTPIE